MERLKPIASWAHTAVLLAILTAIARRTAVCAHDAIGLRRSIAGSIHERFKRYKREQLKPPGGSVCPSAQSQVNHGDWALGPVRRAAYATVPMKMRESGRLDAYSQLNHR